MHNTIVSLSLLRLVLFFFSHVSKKHFNLNRTIPSSKFFSVIKGQAVVVTIAVLSLRGLPVAFS